MCWENLWMGNGHSWPIMINHLRWNGFLCFFWRSGSKPLPFTLLTQVEICAGIWHLMSFFRSHRLLEIVMTVRVGQETKSLEMEPQNAAIQRLLNQIEWLYQVLFFFFSILNTWMDFPPKPRQHGKLDILWGPFFFWVWITRGRFCIELQSLLRFWSGLVIGTSSQSWMPSTVSLQGKWKTWVVMTRWY